MSDSRIKCRSGHSEYLADGREVPSGEYASGVDLSNDHNKRLLDEGRIMEITEKEAERVDAEFMPAPEPETTEAEDETAEPSEPEPSTTTRKGKEKEK